MRAGLLALALLFCRGGPAPAAPTAGVPGADRALAWTASDPVNPATGDRSWHLWCLGLVSGAWSHAGVDDEELRVYSARLSFEAFEKTAVIHDMDREPPPRGAVLYWDWVANGVDYGHTAIANGDGTCTTTRPPGRGDAAGTIGTRFPISGFAHLHKLGWVDPVTRR